MFRNEATDQLQRHRDSSLDSLTESRSGSMKANVNANPYDVAEENNTMEGSNSCVAVAGDNYEPAEPSNEYARIKHPSFGKQDDLYDKLFKPKPDDSGFNQIASITKTPAEPAVQYAVIDQASKKRKVKRSLKE